MLFCPVIYLLLIKTKQNIIPSLSHILLTVGITSSKLLHNITIVLSVSAKRYACIRLESEMSVSAKRYAFISLESEN